MAKTRRRPSDFTIRNVRYRMEHPVRYAALAAGAMGAYGFFLFNGDVRPAVGCALGIAAIAWWMWRPSGIQARRWAERIAHLDDEPIGDRRIDWGPPKSPPTGGGS